MGQELTQVPCPRCGIPGDADPGLSRWQCTSCGSGYFLRRCSACTRVSYVDGLQGFRTALAGSWCGHFNSGFSHEPGPGRGERGRTGRRAGRLRPGGQLGRATVRAARGFRARTRDRGRGGSVARTRPAQLTWLCASPVQPGGQPDRGRAPSARASRMPPPGPLTLREAKPRSRRGPAGGRRGASGCRRP